ncbi:unnamed protein product [Penicillium viridicatum]
MPITPITPTKPLTTQLLRVISRFFREMSNPQFIIEHDHVTTYIISSARCGYGDGPIDDGPITTDLLSGILSRRIGYAPPEFIENLVGPSVGNTDLECMVVLYSLLMMDILPRSGLRMSINRILYSHNGEDLMRHLVDNLDNEASYLLESQLARIL